MIVIVDYGIGNLHSVSKALEKLGFKNQISQDPDLVEKAHALILPGVGSFGEAMEQMEKNNFIEAICNSVQKGKPILGICLGLQLLFEKSQESTKKKGLSLIKGEVRKLPPTNKVPHMGWNKILFTKKKALSGLIPDGRFFYFAHSYYVIPESKECIVGISNYNVVIPVIINQDNIWGVQFHPEKSSKWGIHFLETWAKRVIP
ncbi:imidazole glycerol phosphate synthase subunit HisH [Atribacter laminatus]|jgi:glutamine amidotransferase|uniref:Imidazole glycerol phosphate synthase subunit HisH n=1 Tax=Atribacter laminatus TaxID=2847778 RepID=A0A7T1AJD2_ATRLM|nr:imidazole glycerol phosphate synthase subunit HisH [Atribacter laminatus]QPM67001.1 Imidazole glycerol phosphate synthase subunit HisH [Atribacter laminatus]